MLGWRGSGGDLSIFFEEGNSWKLESWSGIGRQNICWDEQLGNQSEYRSIEAG